MQEDTQEENKKMTIKEKRKLIEDYMSKCPFIEFFWLYEINKETATIDISFDESK
jgi:cob(I)alamin adenosyltransferase